VLECPQSRGCSQRLAYGLRKETVNGEDRPRLCENDGLICANIIVPHEGVHDEAVHRR
jgi:hypothetical protein